jgi:hypothetical protein
VAGMLSTPLFLFACTHGIIPISIQPRCARRYCRKTTTRPQPRRTTHRTKAGSIALHTQRVHATRRCTAVKYTGCQGLAAGRDGECFPRHMSASCLVLTQQS